MNIDILYEDKDVIAINKPSGLMVHGDNRSKEKTLADFILENYPKLKNVGDTYEDRSSDIGEQLSSNSEPQKPKSEIIRPGIVHRLDRETSGVMLIAKTQKSFDNLKKQFQNHVIKKTYQAFCYGWLTRDEGKINVPIGRSPKDFRRYSATRGAKGELREAMTEYKTLRRGSDIPMIEDVKVPDIHKYSFVELYPKTGRTHQIRVHLKYLNHSVVSDDLYAPRRPKAFGFDRVALHALSITFKNLKGEPVTVSAPYPEDFKKALKKIGFE